jgi:hypothetical protein
MNNELNATAVKLFLESWGMHYDTPTGDCTDIPYPQVYERMQSDALAIGGEKLSKFISSITDTIDGKTHLLPISWLEVDEAWENFQL